MIDSELQQECIEQLKHPDPMERVLALRFLLTAPELAASVLPQAEALLNDRAIAMLTLPMRFGEVRNLAAEVVATGRAHLTQSEAVVLEQANRTMTYDAMSRLADSVTTDRTIRDGHLLYQHLRDAGHLKQERLEFSPDWYRP
jgi:hypothetical protein